VQLYILRHGTAEDGRPGRSDADRALTEEGGKRVAEVMKMARRAETGPSLIISSPYVRAVQTARIAAAALDYKGQIVPTEALVPDGSPQGVWTELREYRTEPAILLAGHEPLLSQLVPYLLAAPSLRVEMKKAALVRVDVESFGPSPYGTLRWMITPKLAA
jgi:phosphohistidine phosphatase